MAQYLVLAPAGTADESLLQELTRLAARESSHFHVVVPRRPGGDSAADVDLVAEHHLSALLDALAARGLDADGELGEVSVVGSVARATERTHYDAVVFSLATVGVVETIDLEVARRLHQIDVPLFNLVTPGRPGGAAAPPMKASFRSADRRGLVVGGVLLLILAIVVVVLESRLGTLARTAASTKGLKQGLGEIALPGDLDAFEPEPAWHRRLPWLGSAEEVSMASHAVRVGRTWVIRPYQAPTKGFVTRKQS